MAGNIYYKSAETLYDEMVQPIKGEVNTDSQSLTYRQDMPVAQELSYITMNQDELVKRIHAKTALENGYDEDLIEKCRDMGVEWNRKTKATTTLKLTGDPNSKYPANSLPSTSSGLTYSTIEDCIIGGDGTGTVDAIATDYGSKNNCNAGDICKFSVEYAGIKTVTNEHDVTNGYDDETMQHLYDRYLERVSLIVTSGSVNYYCLEAKNVSGVGSAKGYECTNEKGEHQEGHVLIVITNSNNRSADDSLIKATEKHLEEKRFACAKLHVISASELDISVSCELEINSSMITLDDAKTLVNKSIKDYFERLGLGTRHVYIEKIKSLVFNSSDYINNVKNFKLNNQTLDIDIPVNTIPVYKDLVVSEV